jgi:phosphoribosylamine-glycine ligase
VEEFAASGIEVYFASVREEAGKYLTTSSRSVALLARASSPEEAKVLLDSFLGTHCPLGLYYRHDIPRVPAN